MRKEGRMEFFEGNFSMFHGNQSLKYGFNWSSYRSNFKDKYYFKIYSLYSSNIFERNRNVVTWMWMEMNGNFSRKIKSAISLWRLSTSLSFSFHSFSLISLPFFFLFFSKNNPLLHQSLPVPYYIYPYTCFSFFYANLSRSDIRSKLQRSEWKVLSFARQSGISTLVSIDKNFTRTPLTASIGFLSPLPA